MKDTAKVRIDKIMTETVISVTPDKKVRDIRKLMIEYAISQVPVIEEGKVLGMVSERDIVKAYREHGKKAAGLSVNKVMGPAPPAVEKSSPMERIVDTLMDNPAVLITENGEIKGIITRADVVYWLLDL